VTSRDAALAAEAFSRYTEEWMSAITTRDRAALEAFLAPEFRLTSVRSDQWIGRDQWLELAMNAVEMESFTVEAMEVAIFGDTAVVWARVNQRARVAGDDWSDHFMLTDVWVRRDDRWQVVARHTSRPPAKSFEEPAG
jgi:ketosteroid isomerase-like protein